MNDIVNNYCTYIYKENNNKSANASNTSVNKPKGKNAKKKCNVTDTKTIDKPKEKVKQQKINWVVTPKTTNTTSTTATVTNNSSFSTAVNAQDIITTCSTPPQKRNVDTDSPFSTSSQVFKLKKMLVKGIPLMIYQGVPLKKIFYLLLL